MWSLVSLTLSQLQSQPSGTFRLLAGKACQVGRRKADSNVCLPDETVSKSHAILRVDEGYDVNDPKSQPKLFIRDAKSTCGTTVQGKRIPPGTEVQVENGSEVVFGKRASFRLVYEPLVIVLSPEISSPVYSTVVATARLLGAHVLRQSSDHSVLNDNTTLFVCPPTIRKVTASLLSALIYQCPLVTTKYIDIYKENISSRTPVPDYFDYKPTLSSQLSAKFQLDVENNNRKDMFAGAEFFIVATKNDGMQAATGLKNLIIQAGGAANVVLSEESLPSMLSSVTRIVTFRETISVSIKRLLAKRGFRVIAPCEVWMAIACASTKEYANSSSTKPLQCFIHDERRNECILFSDSCSAMEPVQHSVVELEHDDSASTISDDGCSENMVDHDCTCSNIKGEPIFTSTQRDVYDETPADELRYSYQCTSARGRDLGAGRSQHMNTTAREPAQPQPPPAVITINNTRSANNRRRPYDRSLMVDENAESSGREFATEKRRKVDNRSVDLTSDADISHPAVSLASHHSPNPPAPRDDWRSESRIEPGTWVSTRKDGPDGRSSSSLVPRITPVERSHGPDSIKQELVDDLESGIKSLVVVKYSDSLFDPNCSISNLRDHRSALETSAAQPSALPILSSTSRHRAPVTTEHRFSGQKIFKKVWPLHMVANERMVTKDQLVPAAILEKSRRDDGDVSMAEERDNVESTKTTSQNVRALRSSQAAGGGDTLVDDFGQSQRQNVFRNFYR